MISLRRQPKTPLLVLAVLLIAACWEVSRLRGIINSRPAIEEKTVTRTVQGPTKTEVRTIIKPGGERIEERIVYVESKVTDRAAEHSEKPAKALKTRYVGLRLDPLDHSRPTVRAGLTIWGTWDLGGTFDTRTMRPGVEVAFRF